MKWLNVPSHYRAEYYVAVNATYCVAVIATYCVAVIGTYCVTVIGRYSMNLCQCINVSEDFLVLRRQFCILYGSGYQDCIT